MKSNVTSVDAYLDEVPAERRPALERLRAICSSVHPDAREVIDYGMPVLKVGDTMKVAFASQKNTVSIYGFRHETLERHRAALQRATFGKGCLRYSRPAAIDFALVEAMMIEDRDSGRPGGC